MNKVNNYTHEEFNTYLNTLLKLGSVVQLPTAQRAIADFGLSLVNPPKKYFADCNPKKTEFYVNNANNPTNKGLIVFIHGLNSSPEIGRSLYKKEIEKQVGNEFEIWVPSVPKQGNCSLQEAAQPILEMVKKYIRTNPGKPVQLIGHSNGGRIAGYIETHLRDKNVNMRVTGIAGVFFGSDFITYYKKTGTAHLFLPKVLLKELPTGSKTAKKLVEDMREEVTVGSREYTFYATVNDAAIPNFTSCLPDIQQGEECQVLIGCGHSDIQNKVCKTEVQKVINFLRAHQPMGLSLEEGDFINEATISA